LRDLSIIDFEAGGVTLNGASTVLLQNLDTWPSLTQTFGAKLSHAIFTDHIVNTLMPHVASIASLMASTNVEIRGSNQTVEERFTQLRADLQTFLAGSGGPLLSVMGDGDALPDGSAMCGVVLRRSGVAINGFGCCPDTSIDPLEKGVENIILKHIHIHGLQLKVDQVMTTWVNGNRAVGVDGGVFHIDRAWDISNCFACVGNSFTDAQITMGVFRGALQKTGISKDILFFLFRGLARPA